VSTFDTECLREAYRALLDAAETIEATEGAAATEDGAGSNAGGGAGAAPPEGEWDADQILAHVSIVSATTLATVSAIAAGSHAAYDNRLAHDAWTLDRTIELAGGNAGLRDRLRLQAEALCAVGGGLALSGSELDVPVPTRLLSHGKVLVDQPVTLREILDGLAGMEIPGHTRQLLALRRQDDA
jgi:hypothetical protein